MALGIMMSGLIAAVLGTVMAVAMGLNLGSALVVYGLFGMGGGVLACLSGAPGFRNLRQGKTIQDRTLG